MMTLLYHPIWPTGYFFLSKPFYVLFGHPEWVLRGFSFITGVGSVALVHLILREASGQERLAAWGALLVALLPAHVSISVQSLAEGPFLFFVLACLYALIRGRFFTSAVFLTLATMIRNESLPLLLILPIYLFVQMKKGETRMGWQGLNLKTIFLFTGVSSFFPLLYIGLNKLVLGSLFWQFPVEEPQFWLNSTVPQSVWDACLVTVALFFRGFANTPLPIETAVGPMGFFVGQLDPGKLNFYSYMLFLLVVGLALWGIIYGLNWRWKAIPLLLILPVVFTVFMVLSFSLGVADVEQRLTVPNQVFIMMFTAVGLWNLSVRNDFLKWAGYSLFAITVLSFAFLAYISRYSGPREPYEAALALKELVGSKPVQERLSRAVGLTGPMEQTEFLLQAAGPYSEYIRSWFHTTSDQEVLVLGGGDESLDPYRNTMIQIVADLSFDQHRPISLQDYEPALELQPAMVLLMKDSLELKERGSILRLQLHLEKQGYDSVYVAGPFEIWVANRVDEALQSYSREDR